MTGSPRWGYASAEEWLRSPEPMTWRRVFWGKAEHVAVARAFAAGLFLGTGFEDEVAFIVTELAANAVLHTRSGHEGGWFGLEATLADVAYLAVTDLGGGGYPTVRPERLGDGCNGDGRGLLAVSKLAVALGVHGSPNVGHTVWADVDLKAEAQARPDLAVVLVA